MPHNVVIIGAGYAGLPAAARLARQVRPDDVTVTLVSAFDEFVERPRLHQMAVGQVIERVPLSRYLAGSRVELIAASVTDIDLIEQHLHTVDATGRQFMISFDTLIYALGSNMDLTAVSGVAEYCTSLVGTASAADLLTRLTDMAAGDGTVTVCGGGSTGIEIVTEIAGAFPTIHAELVSARPPGEWLSDRGRRHVDDALAALAVSVVDDARVERVEPGGLVLAAGRHLPFELCIWACGFTVPDLAGRAGLAVNAAGRALVDTTLRSVTHPNVYVIGDAAAISGSWGGELAMGCRTGGFSGPQVADIIASRLSRRVPTPFRFRYIHECISFGREDGLVQFFTRDGTPKERILTGRSAIAYKNATLNGAKLLFRHPGPILARRRHRAPGAEQPPRASVPAVRG